MNDVLNGKKALLNSFMKKNDVSGKSKVTDTHQKLKSTFIEGEPNKLNGTYSILPW